MLIPDFKRKIVGCIDLLFLFPRGVAAFKGEKATAIKTFALLTIIFWPLAPITAAMVPPVGFEGLTYGQQVLNIFFHDIISLILSLAFSWQVAGFLEKRERYWLAMEVGAWVSAFFTVLVMIPLLYVDYHKLAPTEALQRIYAVLAIYSYIVGGVITYGVYRVNVPFIIGWMAGGLFIERESWNLLLLIQGMPLLP